MSIVQNDNKAAETLTPMTSGLLVIVGLPGSRVLQIAKATKSKTATKGAAAN